MSLSVSPRPEAPPWLTASLSLLAEGLFAEELPEAGVDTGDAAGAWPSTFALPLTALFAAAFPAVSTAFALLIFPVVFAVFLKYS